MQCKVLPHRRLPLSYTSKVLRPKGYRHFLSSYLFYGNVTAVPFNTHSIFPEHLAPSAHPEIALHALRKMAYLNSKLQ